MKKLSLLVLCCLIPLTAHAKIEIVNANGVGNSVYSATMDAIDNAVRQSGSIEIKNDKNVDLSRNHILVQDDRDIEIKHNQKSVAEVNSNENSNGSFWSKLKFWAKDENSENFEYKNKGGNLEITQESVQREINAKYEGVIEGYEIIKSEQKKDGSFEVSIAAKVKKLDEYESPDLVKKAKYTVAIVPAGEKNSWNCIGTKKSADSIENKIIDQITTPIVKSKKITVVDRTNVDKQLKELSLIGQDLTSESSLNKLKQIKIADYLLVVTVKSFNANKWTKEIELTGEKITSGSANLSASYKLIETATMEVVSMGDSYQEITLGSGASCDTAVSGLSKKASKELVDDLLNNF